MRPIRKTVTLTVCFGQRLNALGEFEDFVEDLPRAITAERATKYFRRKYKDDTITINHTEEDTSTYELSLDGFLKHAHAIND